MVLRSLIGGDAMRRLWKFSILIFLTGCAGRAPELTPLVQVVDQQMNCDQIVAEIRANNQRISDLAAEEGMKVTQNVAAGVAGLLIPVLWFGMDFQDAAGKEGKALSQRNEYLASLAKDRCGPPSSTASIQRR
jgi:hypothetical protein